MKLKGIVYALCAAALCSCGTNKEKVMAETEVRIETSAGNIKVKLYNDTPLHRDNFIRLAKMGAYDNILFHRVVHGFMIQTGDPAIKPGGAAPTVDTTALSYTVPAEIHCPRHFHKRGALAAARMGNDVNPERASSGTQFYIVTGQTYTNSSLMELYSAIYQNQVDMLCAEMTRPYLDEILQLRRIGDRKRYEALKDSLLRRAEDSIAANPPTPFNDAQKATYTTVGGAPHLDGEYTVFGEVVEGINVAESIAKTRTSGERPLKEIVVNKVTVLE